MRRVPRKDANHAAIAGAFSKLGCSVLDLAAVGGGCPDLLVARRGQMRLVEVKDGRRPQSARRFTEQQSRFHALWNGHVCVAMDHDDVVRIVESMGGKH